MASVLQSQKINANFQPQPTVLAAEDAADESREAVQTFATYIPPIWARTPAKRKPIPTTMLSKIPSTAINTQHDVIVIDESDDDEKKCEPDTVTKDKELSHSSPACESGLLASVSAPQPRKECLQVVTQLAEEGKLSPLQVEGVGLAIHRHCRLLKQDNDAAPGTPKQHFVRAGFFLGDGAGIGKGRQIAAVLRDSLSRSIKDNSKGLVSRRRHLWLSVSRELVEDARRDLEDIGCYVPVLDGAEALGSNIKAGGTRDQSGILFITYALLVTMKGKRMEDIIKWLSFGQTEASFDGCIIFDEAHKAKNLCADPPTATGKLVLALQNRLPLSRVMYCSATGVSDLKQMAYAVRLGLWGHGTNFPSFDAFRNSLEKRGVGAMELLALEMKQAGCFVARTLSWDGAEFNTEKVSLSPEQVIVYDRAMNWWEMVKHNMKEVLADPIMGGTPKMLWSQYWSCIQRFTKELAICAKVPNIAEDALKQLAKGHSIVIGLQSTGEASANASLEELQKKQSADNIPIADPEDVILDNLLSTSAAIMAGFIRTQFPVAPLPSEPMKIPHMSQGGSQTKEERLFYERLEEINSKIRNQPPQPPKPELLRLRQKILEAISDIPLPPAPLDDLIDRLGGVENVAEMTGRSGRVIRLKTGKFKFVKRIGASKEKQYGLSMPLAKEDADRLNIVEKKKFIDGRKTVAIISDAASTGISLHAMAKSQASHRRRVHYTIELPWAADKAIQQLGRTHRSGQISAPIYKMVVTNLGGERRFAAAVAKRMASLGALTKGDRRAASGSDLSEFDIDSRFGRRALKRFYDCMTAEPPYPPSKATTSILDSYLSSINDSLLEKGRDEVDNRLFVLSEVKMCLESVGIDPANDLRKSAEVKVFLNRIAALSVAKQNLVFSLFTSTMDDILSEAKTTGEFEGSVEDVRATSICLSTQPENITLDHSSGAFTKLAIFHVDRGCSFDSAAESALAMIPEMAPKDADVEEGETHIARSGFYISKNRILGRFLVLFAERKYRLSPEEESDTANRTDYDPLGLMVLTRPNTGKNPCEKATFDLVRTYRLIASIDDIRRYLENDFTKNSLLKMMTEKHKVFNALWVETYTNSNKFRSEVGLAARKSKLGIMTGSVLHCLPALETSVASRKLSERSLKIVRVEISSTGERFVGMKYPVDDAALINLRATMATLNAARSDKSSSSSIDEAPDPVQMKSISWLTSPPQTMKNFFKTVNSPTTTKRKATPSSSSDSTANKKPAAIASKKNKSGGKAKSITSFFSPTGKF